MKYTNKDIIEKLSKIGELERKKQQLEFELENYIDMVSGDDIIEAKTFKSGVAEVMPGGHHGDITADLAVSYGDKTARMNICEKQALNDSLRRVELEIKRITYYVSLLDNRQADVIRTHYFEGCPLPQTAINLGLSITTMRRVLKSAVTNLTDMYNLVVS